jgi:hypothetical protein
MVLLLRLTIETEISSILRISLMPKHSCLFALIYSITLSLFRFLITYYSNGLPSILIVDDKPFSAFTVVSGESMSADWGSFFGRKNCMRVVTLSGLKLQVSPPTSTLTLMSVDE